MAAARTLCRLNAHLLLCVLSGLLLPSPGAAQASARCSATEYRQLDFWLGEWEVRTEAGDVVGSSTITPVLDGCAIQEDWTSSQVQGRSLSSYNRPEDRWEQFWVDDMGVILTQTGGWSGEEFRWRAERRGSDGRVRQLRVRLTLTEDGVVRQLQERSEDGGESWAVIFDGYYHPVDGAGR